MCCPQSRKDFINTANGSIYFPKKDQASEEISGAYICDQSPEIFLNQSGRKAGKQNKAWAGWLFASLIPAKLAQNWRKTCRISVPCESRDEFLPMHNRKLNGCQQMLLFAVQLIPRKCSHTPEIAGRTHLPRTQKVFWHFTQTLLKTSVE